MQRRILIHGPLDPYDGTKTIYILDCGHWVSRKTQGWKKIADCGRCDSESSACGNRG